MAIFETDCWEDPDILRILGHSIESMDIKQDPFIVMLLARDDEKSKHKLRKTLETRKTPCYEQLKKLHSRAFNTHQELGLWAVDNYLFQCINHLKDKMSDESWSLGSDWDKDDDIYLSRTLSNVEAHLKNYTWDNELAMSSNKVNVLIELLEREYASDFTGIVFAENRCTVLMLSHLLSSHPRMKNIRPGYIIGSSQDAKRASNIFDLHDPRNSRNSVDDLRNGKINLLVATSVLEEGIDVAACNIVICFDSLTTLRSFIQRKGRARKNNSKFVLFSHRRDYKTLKDWQDIEKYMKEEYEKEKRALPPPVEMEEEGYPSRRIESTGYVSLSYPFAVC